MIWMLVLVVIRNFILSSSGAKNTVIRPLSGLKSDIYKFSYIIVFFEDAEN